MPNRRHVLELLLAGAAISAAGCAPADLPDPVAGWRTPGAGEADPRRHALAHAILAPNPHNMQPWLVSLTGDDALTLHIDRTRLLPATDPPNRQITVGCGAFLELLDIAARQNGHRLDTALWPDGEPQPVLDDRAIAHVRFIRDAAVTKDPLYPQITARRTSREPFDVKRVPAPQDLAAVAMAPAPLTAGVISQPDQVSAQRDLVWRGWSREMATPAAVQETVNVMRIGAKEVAEHRDGIVLAGPAIEALKAFGLIDRKALLDPASEMSKQGATMWKKLAETAPAFVWLKGPDNSRATQIAAGRAYARMTLEATARGLSMHPWSMGLEEYPEMADIYAEQQAALGGTPAAPVQMLARIGYAKVTAPAPRRSIEDFLQA